MAYSLDGRCALEATRCVCMCVARRYNHTVPGDSQVSLDLLNDDSVASVDTANTDHNTRISSQSIWANSGRQNKHKHELVEVHCRPKQTLDDGVN